VIIYIRLSSVKKLVLLILAFVHRCADAVPKQPKPSPASNFVSLAPNIGFEARDDPLVPGFDDKWQTVS
jgi:hypothetical protein